mmetsp:Transcript_24877/g.65368  ORF Transcript_24877/g.65368 Transcript_24877/m.65368 type:complete len:224 (-) Transcript_24877:112-783(-)
MNASVLHDVPIIGHYTLAARQNFSDFFAEPLRDQIVAFAMLDKNNTGFLTKTELAEALRLMGKSDREIQEAVNSVPGEVDFDRFRELLRPKSQPYTKNVGFVPVPNLRKAHEVPMFGALTKGTESLVTSWVSTAALVFHTPSDTDLMETFENLDKDGDGELDKEEVAEGLRAHGTQETDIKRVMDDLGDSAATFQEFKDTVHKTRRSSVTPIIPGVPFALGAN